MDKKAQELKALMKYTAILPVLQKSDDDARSNNEIFREISIRGVFDSESGELRYFAVPTIKRWYNQFRKNSLGGLTPKGRDDANKSRKIDETVNTAIKELMTAFPKITAAEIGRRLVANGCIARDSISGSTINRCVNQIKKEIRYPEPEKEMRRYERKHINEVWCADTCVGPSIEIDKVKYKTYFIGIIDDASRMIVGIDVFLNDNYINFSRVLQSAIKKYGLPKRLNLDNGSPYKNIQMSLLAARLGISLFYDKPYTPTAKAKIERFFGTFRRQWLSCTDFSSCKNLEQVRSILFNYIIRYNNTPHSSLPKSDSVSVLGAINTQTDNQTCNQTDNQNFSGDSSQTGGKTDNQTGDQTCSQELSASDGTSDTASASMNSITAPGASEQTNITDIPGNQKLMTPVNRFFSESNLIKRLDIDRIDELFLLEIERKVSADGVVKIQNCEYEISSIYARRKMTFRYSPDYTCIYLVDDNKKLVPVRVLDKKRNSSFRRKTFYTSPETAATTNSGGTEQKNRNQNSREDNKS